MISFQFHYGSIKIQTAFCNINFISEFQFHYGSIKIEDAAADLGLDYVFQFHYGSIKIRSMPLLVLQNSIVSIPLWFD